MKKGYMHFFSAFFVLLLTVLNAVENSSEEKKLKVLHLTFHQGCANEIQAVADALSIDLETWFIQTLPPAYFDGQSYGNVLYNLTHQRAKRIWELHQDFFNSFDAIITSDTAPLCRIFLQNGFKKPLIIWICNRFDYYDGASLDGCFPDSEYYHLFRKAGLQENVTIVAYTPFEHYYTRSKGVDTGNLVITPCSPSDLIVSDSFQSIIPQHIVKEETFFLPPYHNETIYMNFSAHCTQLGIPNYCGRYNGPFDLKDFKGIIHLPYSWSNLAFFENIKLGIPYFIPSESFFQRLATSGNYFHPNLNSLLHDHLYHLSEWYCPEHRELIIYFDSWEDLQAKIDAMDFPKARERVKAFAEKLRIDTLGKWQQVFDKAQK